MSWVKIDDQLPRHPKVIGLPVSGKWAFIEALCYCAQYLTDGVFPSSILAARDLAVLREAGLIEPRGEGWLVHDYLDYNPTRTDVEGSREQARERMRDVRTNTDARSDAVRPNIGKSSPNPVPVPQPLTPRARYSPSFTAFWAAYPRRVGKRTAATAFDRATKRTEAKIIIEGAERLAADPNLPEERFIPHPTTWLNRDGWDDPPCAPALNGKARTVNNILALADQADQPGKEKMLP